MFRAVAAIASVALLGLSACGDTTTSQAIIGGAAGAGVAAATNSSIAAGTAIGAGVNVLYCEANPGKC